MDHFYTAHLVNTQSNLYFKDTSKELAVLQLRQDLLGKNFPYSHIFLHSLTLSQLGVFPATSLSLFPLLHHQQAGRLSTRTTTQSATSLPSSSPFGYIKTIFRLLPKNLNILKIINCGWVTKCLPASRRAQLGCLTGQWGTGNGMEGEGGICYVGSAAS